LPNPAGAYMNMPWLGVQTIVFAKEDLLTFAVGPTGGGSTAPTTGYFLDNAPLPIVAYASSGYKFSSWASGSSAVTFANTTRSSTTVVATGPATITAKFATGTTCTKCTATFYQLGLPTGTTWDVTVNGVTTYSTTSSIVLTGITSAFYFATPGYLSAGPGVTYQPVAVSTYFDIPYQSSVTLQYEKYYLVAFGQSPSYSISLTPSATNWYLAGSTIPLVATGNDNWVLKSWSSSAKTLALSSKSSPALDVVVGATGTVTANIVSPLKTIEYGQTGLPVHSTWSLVFNGQTFYSSGWDLNVTSVPTVQYNYWSVPLPVAALKTYGVQYAPVYTSGYIGSDYTPFVLIQFVQQDWVGFVAGGTTGGSVYPASAGWYNVGTILAIDAVNGTSVSFTKWTGTGGPFTIAQTTWAATSVTIAGPGNLTATFK